jgi:hypothetical protein
MYTPLPNLLAPNVHELERFGIPTRPREPLQPSFASTSGLIGGADSGINVILNITQLAFKQQDLIGLTVPLSGVEKRIERMGGLRRVLTRGVMVLPSELVPNIRREVRTGGRVRRIKRKEWTDLGRGIQGGQILYNSKTNFRR